MENPEIVKPLFSALDSPEFVLVPNDPILHELAGFIEGLETLKSLHTNEITFYAHTKGVRKRDCSDIEQLSVRQWRNRMYHECLSQPEKIDSILKVFSACGCFLRPGRGGLHFPGTFYWINHNSMFSKPNWNSIHNDRFGPEDWIPIHFTNKDLYNLRTISDTVQFYSTAFGVYKCLECKREFGTTIQDELNCPYCKQQQHCDDRREIRRRKRHHLEAEIKYPILIDIPDMGF